MSKYYLPILRKLHNQCVSEGDTLQCVVHKDRNHTGVITADIAKLPFVSRPSFIHVHNNGHSWWLIHIYSTLDSWLSGIVNESEGTFYIYQDHILRVGFYDRYAELIVTYRSRFEHHTKHYLGCTLLP